MRQLRVINKEKAAEADKADGTDGSRADRKKADRLSSAAEDPSIALEVLAMENLDIVPEDLGIVSKDPALKDLDKVSEDSGIVSEDLALEDPDQILEKRVSEDPGTTLKDSVAGVDRKKWTDQA